MLSYLCYVLELPRLAATLNQHVVLSFVQLLKFQKLPLCVASVARQHVVFPFVIFAKVPGMVLTFFVHSNNPQKHLPSRGYC